MKIEMIDSKQAGRIPPICIENLSKCFRGKRGSKVLALDNVSFNVVQGETFAFLGPNGAGKSTTIKTLMGLIRPTGGRALLNGLSSTNYQSRKEVGYLPENPSFYDFLTAREYLNFVADSFTMNKDPAKSAIQKALERLDLAVAADRPIRGYSKGMVQRLGLAQSLIHDPEVFVLDEPMSGLDPQGRALVKEIIRELGNAGKTVFFSTHITSDVEKICDRLAIIVNGRIQLVSSVAEILEQGIEGFRVLVSGLTENDFPDVEFVREVGDCLEFTVERGDLPAFIDAVSKKGGLVELVEPLRRDLEQYFLDVVRNSSR